MSLTVASTSLDTSWGECTVVGYTVGTLADEDACVAEVQSKLNRGTLTDSTKPTVEEVKNWLSIAKQELSETRSFSWRRRYVTVTLTAGEYRYSLPPDFGGGRLNIRDKTNDNKIKMVNEHVFDTLYPDPSEVASGEILVACIKNMELWVIPAPDGDDELELEYKRTGDDQTIPEARGYVLSEDDDPLSKELGGLLVLEGAGEAAAGDLTWLPEIERFRCCDFATWKAFESIDQDVAAKFYKMRWSKGLKKSVRSDGKRKWSTSGFRIRSVFQA